MIKKEIRVKEITVDSDGWVFLVTVVEDDKKTEHVVSLTKDMFDRLNFNRAPKEVVEISFNFLLKKEKKEDILKSFDLSKITEYFPNFEKYLRNKLKN